MAGHSKWANIQHRKKAQDAKRGKIFTRVTRELTVASRESGPDPESNPRLRLAMEKATAANMGKENINRAIQRGSDATDKNNFESVSYEGFGPGGIAIIVECATDNRNRTVAEVRYVFSRAGGSFGESGSVSYLFNRRGVIYCQETNEEALLAIALEHDVEDIAHDGNQFVATVAPENLFKISKIFGDEGVEVASNSFEMVPSTRVNLTDEDTQKAMHLLELLEEINDVQCVHTNADFSSGNPDN